MAGEFELIARYFTRPSPRADVVLGVGDDCALLAVPPGQLLAVSLDTLVAGVHFPLDTAPADIAAKAVAVNLSDLAAMGAEPAWMTLGLTLPEADEAWLDAFARGLFEALDAHGVALVGGDTTRGPLALSLQAHGFVPPGLALTRAGAQAGDLVYVSGSPGDAGLGLAIALGRHAAAPAHADYLLSRLNRPTPRVALGLALCGHATAAIDVSDGLSQDLGHVLAASQVGAELDLDALPLSQALRAEAGEDEAIRLALGAGDDYELLFTAPAGSEAAIAELSARLQLPLTAIGRIHAEPGLSLLRHGRPHAAAAAGYRHF